MIKKMVLSVLRLIVKWLKKLGLTMNDIVYEVTIIMVNEAKALEDMTIAELRNLAKSNGISLEGKRVKGEIVEVIKKQMDLEWFVMVGDIIFVEGTGIVSWLIKKVTGGKWSHVAMFVNDDYLVETEWNTRGRLININDTDYLTKNHEIIHIELTKEQQDLLNVAIYPFLGAKYDYLLIFKLFIKHVLKIGFKRNTPQEVVCSELVAHILLILGVFGYNEFGVTNYSPNELYRYLKEKY